MNLLAISVYITAYFGLFISSLIFLTYLGNRHRIRDPEPKRFPFVSFIVPVFDEEKAIKETITSLANIDYPKNKYEIIIVDDGSTDKTYRVAKKLAAHSTVPVKIFTKTNGGCANALNFGLKHAHGEIIARFDADTTLDKSALLKTIGYFENPKVMAVTSSLNVLNHKGFLQRIQWAEYFMGIFLRKIFDLNQAIHIIPGPLSVYRAKLFEKLGGFDEANITEDTEMAMRVQSHGYEIRNSMSAMVYTITPTRFSQLIKQRIRWYSGFMRNSWDYKHLFDARRKTDLSTWILPASFITIFLSFFSLFVFAYYNIRAVIDYFIQLSVTGFGMPEFFHNLNWQTITDALINYATSQYIFFFVIGTLAMLLYFLIAKYYSGEKRGIFRAFILFMLFYFPLFVFFWTIALYYTITGKKTTWGHRVYSRGRML